MAVAILRHLDLCPKCDNHLHMSVKIQDNLIKDVEDKDEAGTIYYSCSGETSHHFKLTPAGKLVRLPDTVVSAPRKRTAKKAKKAKKETRKIRKVKVIKKKK